MSLRKVTNDGQAKAMARPVRRVKTACCHGCIAPVPMRMAWMIARTPMNALIAATRNRWLTRLPMYAATAGLRNDGTARNAATAPTQRVDWVRS